MEFHTDLLQISENNYTAQNNNILCTFKGQSLQLSHLKYVFERHGPMGDTMDKQCLQNPLDVVEGVTHAGQAATGHTHTNTLTYLTVINAVHYTWP